VWKNFRDFPVAERHEQGRVFDHINTVHTKGTSEMISTDRMTMRCNFPIGAARSTVTASSAAVTMVK